MPETTAKPFDWKLLRERAVETVCSDNLPRDIELPALPTVVTEFVQKSAEPDVDISTLARIVEKDTALTVELLRHVNSAAFALRSPARSVASAVSLIGVNAAKVHLLAVGMRAATRAMNSRLINQRNFWNESMQRALFARDVATKLRLDAGLAFLGGLLQDYLLPVLTNTFDSEYIRFMEYDAKDGRDLADWEDETFGWNHATAGAWFAARWHFPDDLLCAIFFHHSVQATLDDPAGDFFNLFPIAVSSMLPDQLMQTAHGFVELIRIDAQCPAIGLTDICARVDEEQMQLAEGYQIPNHLSGLLEETRRAVAPH